VDYVSLLGGMAELGGPKGKKGMEGRERVGGGGQGRGGRGVGEGGQWGRKKGVGECGGERWGVLMWGGGVKVWWGGEFYACFPQGEGGGWVGLRESVVVFRYLMPGVIKGGGGGTGEGGEQQGWGVGVGKGGDEKMGGREGRVGGGGWRG